MQFAQKPRRFKRLMHIFIVAMLFGLAACAGSDYKLSGSVNGLQGTGLVLLNNGEDTRPISGNGKFTFDYKYPFAYPYKVSVGVQPNAPSQICQVSNDQGTLEKDVSNVEVNCFLAYQIGGAVTGLLPGKGLILSNKGGDDLTVSSNSTFSFKTPLVDGTDYVVTITTQPVDERCKVTNGSGVLTGADITNVAVTCSPLYSVGGTVSGLRNSGLVLHMNSAAEGFNEDLTVSADGSYAFTALLTDTADYTVTIARQPDDPSAQTCTISNGSAVVSAAAVTNIAVNCAPVPPVLTAAYGPKQIKLQWGAISGADFYRVLKDPDGVSGFSQIGGDITTSSYTDTISIYRYNTGGNFLGSFTRLSATNSLKSVGNEVWGTTANLIYRWDTSGNYLSSINTSDAFDMLETVGNEVWAASGGNADVYRYDTGGNFLGSFTRQSVTNNLNSVGNEVWGTMTDLIYRWDTSGSDLSTIDTNTGVAFDLLETVGDEVWAASSGSADVYRYDTGGSLLSRFTRLSATNSLLSVGYEIWGATDNLIYRWNTSGTYLGSIATAGTFDILEVVGNEVWAASSSNADVYRYDWPNVNYKVEACNNGGCTESNVLSGLDLVKAVGYVKASNTDPGDGFGYAFALSGDGNTLAIGAFNEDGANTGVDTEFPGESDNSASNSGAVYVLVRDTATGDWSQQAYIKASNTDAQDNFGIAVSLSSDGNTLAVGASGEDSAATGINNTSPGQGDNTASNSGAVYIFSRSGTSWNQQAYVKASNTGAQDNFGYSLMLSGDGATLAAGAYFEDSAATGIDGTQTDNSAGNSGAVYVFTLSGTDWGQQAYIKASNTDAGDFFGRALALSGDGSTLAVGAYGEDSAATDVNNISPGPNDNTSSLSGAVYVFTRAITWSQQAYIKASNTDASDSFGYALALSDDGATLAVGAQGEASAANVIGGDQTDNTAPSSGAVYVLVRDTTTGDWSQQAYVKASNAEAGDQFGHVLSLSDNGDTLVVGANLEDAAGTAVGGDMADNAAVNSGAAYVFVRSVSAWDEQAYIKASNTETGDSFGDSIGLSDDGNSLVVGASLEGSAATNINATSPGQGDNTAAGSGAAYIY